MNVLLKTAEWCVRTPNNSCVDDSAPLDESGDLDDSDAGRIEHWISLQDRISSDIYFQSYVHESIPPFASIEGQGANFSVQTLFTADSTLPSNFTD